MDDAERWWVVGAGLIGLACLAGGSLLNALPRPDATEDHVVGHLVARRRPILAGSVLVVSGAGLLLWPLVAAVRPTDTDGWATIGPFSVAAWVLGFGFLAVAALTGAAVVWRDPAALDPSTRRLALDLAHLATWAVSAPVGAIAVVATTVASVQADVAGLAVVVGAAAKVVTVVVELAGTGRRAGWNAGGWAAGSSGYLTVAWFGVVLATLA